MCFDVHVCGRMSIPENPTDRRKRAGATKNALAIARFVSYRDRARSRSISEKFARAGFIDAPTSTKTLRDNW